MSLHFKILVGYVAVAAAIVGVFYVGQQWDWSLKITAAFIVPVTTLLRGSISS